MGCRLSAPLLAALVGLFAGQVATSSPSVAPREEVVSVRPLVIVVRDFASPAECQKVLELIDRCHQHNWPECQELHSRLHAKGKSSGKLASGRPWRNSTSFTLQLKGELDEAVDELVQRSHLTARHPITYGEGVQVASYYAGDYYEFHHDSLSRRATLLLYLTDVAEGDGGETIFPLVRRSGAPEDRTPPLPPAVLGHGRSRLDFKIDHMEEMTPYCDSDYYLKIRPEVGKAVLFYSYRPDYSLDEYAVHGACPLKRGHKAIFQRWMRFEENSLVRNSEDANVRRSRVEWGHERLLKPGTTEPPASSGSDSETTSRTPSAHASPKLRQQLAKALEEIEPPSSDLLRHEM